MTAPVLGDALGPAARRRALIATIVSGALIVVLFGMALKRFSDKGQLEGDLWAPLTDLATLRFLLAGLVNTLRAAAVAMALAMVVGAFLALGRLTSNPFVRNLAGAYVELFRSVPLLLLMFFSAHGLPKLGFDLPIYWYVVAALVAYNSAVLGEIFRSGILSLDRGQSEAAAAIGMRYWQSMFLVIIPQAVRRMVPAIVSQSVTLLKDTSLGFVVTYEELLRRAEIAGEFGRNLLQAYLFVALCYLLVNLSLSQLARRLETRQARRYRSTPISVTGAEDVTITASRSLKP